MKALEKYKFITKYFLLVSLMAKYSAEIRLIIGRFCRLKCILGQISRLLPCMKGFDWHLSDNHK